MKKTKYKDKNIEFSESPKPKISIDGEPIHVSRDAEANEFVAAELPYHSFKSAEALAKAVVDRRLQEE